MIKFYYVSKEEYDGLGTPETDSLYFCSNGYLYKGKVLIASASEAAISTLSSALNNVITVVESHDTSITNMNTTLGEKADASNVYTKTEIDSKVSTLNTAINGKVSTSDFNTLKQTVTTNENDIESKVSSLIEKDESHDESIKNINTSLGEKVSTSSFNALQATVEDQGDSITDIQADITALEKKDTELNNLIAGHTTTINSHTTDITQMKQDIKTNATGVSNNLSSINSHNTRITNNTNNITTVTNKVNTLVGSDTNLSAREIAVSEVTKIVAGAGESFDTLKEIADWISSHSDSASAMNSQINTNKANIATNTASINQEITDRKDAISAEQTARLNGDSEIKGITGEGISGTTLTAAVTQLQTDLNAEISTRADEDATLKELIDDNTNAIGILNGTTIPALEDDIEANSNGVNQNAEAIVGLGERITEEVDTLKQADSTIQSNLNAAQETLITAINTERTDRITADNELKTNITTNTNSINTHSEQIATNTTNIGTNTTAINNLKKVATSSANGLMSSEDKAFIDFIKTFFTLGNVNQFTIGGVTLVYDTEAHALKAQFNE